MRLPVASGFEFAAHTMGIKDVWLEGPCTLFLAGFPDSPCLFTLQVQI